MKKIIPLEVAAKQEWQKSLSQLITDPRELFSLLALDQAELAAAIRATELFGLKVSREFVGRMQKGKRDDPLLRQILPLGEEFAFSEGFSKDPLQEVKCNAIPGLLHKYQGRVLLTVSGSCAVNCRYCFRRYFPYEKNLPGLSGFDEALEYIQNDPGIFEVIFSGGDPLSVSDTYLKTLIEKIEAIPHVTTLRIHTRFLIIIPSRVTDSLLNIFKSTRLRVIIVNHCNHAQEIDAQVTAAWQKLKDHHILLLNQAVLLKGVNDTAEALVALSQALFHAGVLPYYLHLLDRVQGAAHFEIDLATAKKLMQKVQASLPGYLVPKLAREEANHSSKLLIDYNIS